MLYKLQREICSIRQGSLTVIMYYTALKQLWEEYRVLEPIPICTCGAGKQIAEHGTRTRLIQFLMGLSDSFDSTRDQILLLDPVPSVAKGYSMVLRVEKQRESHLQFGDGIEQSTHYVKSGLGNGSRSSTAPLKPIKDGDKFYTYCRESNHTKENCFKLIGYPDWWKEKKRGQKSTKPGSAAANMRCSTPLDASDSDGEKENQTLKKDSGMTSYIQREISREIARMFKGKSLVGNKQQ